MECRTNQRKHIGLLFAALLMLGAAFFVCVFVERGPIGTLVHWFGFVLFGFAFLKILWDLLHPATKIIINDNGIENRRSRLGVIPWSEIIAIDLRWVISVKLMCIKVRNPDQYIERMPALTRLCIRASGLLGYPPITMAFTGLSPSVDEAWEYIKATYPPLAVESRKRPRRTKIALWWGTSLLMAMILLFVMHRPTFRVLAQWQQPAELTYDDCGPYYVSIVERDIDWAGFPLHIEHNHFIYVGRDSGSPSYGHMIKFSFHPSFDDYYDLPASLQKTDVEWTAEGVEMTFDSGHRLFVPKKAFMGGR